MLGLSWDYVGIIKNEKEYVITCIVMENINKNNGSIGDGLHKCSRILIDDEKCKWACTKCTKLSEHVYELEDYKMLLK